MSAAAAAAAAHLRLLHEEEERLSQYTPEELAEGWEFKILRANTAAFGDPVILRRVCDEEAMNGWVLVEKFDDYRLRFKRPASARNIPAHMNTGLDPYRTSYGISQGAMAALIFVAVFAAVGILIVIVVAAASPR